MGIKQNQVLKVMMAEGGMDVSSLKIRKETGFHYTNLYRICDRLMDRSLILRKVKKFMHNKTPPYTRRVCFYSIRPQRIEKIKELIKNV